MHASSAQVQEFLSLFRFCRRAGEATYRKPPLLSSLRFMMRPTYPTTPLNFSGGMAHKLNTAINFEKLSNLQPTKKVYLSSQFTVASRMTTRLRVLIWGYKLFDLPLNKNKYLFRRRVVGSRFIDYKLPVI